MKNVNSVEVNKEKISEIINKNSLYIKLINSNLNSIKREFIDLKDYYSDDSSNILYERLNQFTKNFKIAYDNLNILNDLLINTLNLYKEQNKIVTKSINSESDKK